MSNKKQKTEVIEGVVAEYNGKFWGFQHGDIQYTHNDFGDFDKAKICDAAFCGKPTDMTWEPKDGRSNSDYEQLKKAKLVKVRKTIITEFEILE